MRMCARALGVRPAILWCSESRLLFRSAARPSASSCACALLTLLSPRAGWQLGEHDTWAKMTNFEVALRTPLIIRAPWMKASVGKVTSVLAEAVEIGWARATPSHTRRGRRWGVSALRTHGGARASTLERKQTARSAGEGYGWEPEQHPALG